MTMPAVANGLSNTITLETKAYYESYIREDFGELGGLVIILRKEF